MADDNPIRILCVDDEAGVLKAVKRVFENEPYEVLTAASGKEGLKVLEEAMPVHVVIADYRMPQMDGVEFLRRVYHSWPDTVRMVLSGFADTSTVIAAINEGQIYKFIIKPWNNDELRITVANAIERYVLVQERNRAEKALKDYLEDLEVIVAERTRELREANELSRALTWRLAEAEETERKAITRELHDRVGQNLNAVNLNLAIIRSLVPPSLSEAVGGRLDDALTLVKETTKSIRNLMADLRPPVLEDYGLIAAMNWYGQHWAERTGINCVVSGEELVLRPPLHVESALYRITLEALANVAKHSGATRVIVSLSASHGKLSLEVRDNGQGYAIPSEEKKRPAASWGLFTMAERAQAVGGAFHVLSESGKGTTVTAEVPL